MRVYGQFLKINTVSPSGILFTEECIENMCKQMKEQIQRGNNYGEFKEKAEDNLGQGIDLRNASHKILSISYDKERGIYAEIELLKYHLESIKEQLSIAPRMRGTVKFNDEGDKIIDDMKIITFDLTHKIV